MAKKDYDWSSFTVRVNIKASPQTIYNYWATQENLEKWFLRLAEFKDSKGNLIHKKNKISKGDTYKWMWHGYGDEVVETGKILKANGKNFLQFTFAGDCIVTVKIKKDKKENILELKQENIPTDNIAKVNYHLGCQTGWTFYMANLKSLLQGGIDLRNKNLKLQKMLNA
ncbi:MAG TPA: SRPBCC domain-containing protein [Ignavibacteriaceae bacterium]|nr:SRPBCC domain-containing protein [Ignavibacteriaceae bacterium]